MGKTFSIENKPFLLEDILAFKEKQSQNTMNTNNITSKSESLMNKKVLRVWEFSESLKKEIISKKKTIRKTVFCEPLNILSVISKENNWLNTRSSYLILVSYCKEKDVGHDKDLSSERSENILYSSLIEYTEMLDKEIQEKNDLSSNLTKRGLEFVFPSFNNDEDSLFSHSKRSGNSGLKSSAEIAGSSPQKSALSSRNIKYALYLWNGCEVSEEVKSQALINAHKLSKELGNKEIGLSLISSKDDAGFSVISLPEKILMALCSCSLKKDGQKEKKDKSKRKGKERFKNFKSAFLNLNLKEDVHSIMLNSSSNNMTSNSSIEHRLNNKDQKNEEKQENIYKEDSFMDNYYSQFGISTSSRGIMKIPLKKSISSRKKSSKRSKNRDSFEKTENDNYHDDADDEEIDDLDTDIIIPTTQKHQPNSSVTGISTGLSGNFSLNMKNYSEKSNKEDSNIPTNQQNAPVMMSKLNFGSLNIPLTQNVQQRPPLSLGLSKDNKNSSPFTFHNNNTTKTESSKTVLPGLNIPDSILVSFFYF